MTTGISRNAKTKERQLASVLISTLFLITPLLALLVVAPANVSANLPGHGYYVGLQVTSSVGDQTNYQMKLTVYSGVGTNAAGVIYLNSHALNWPYDVRFTKADYSTQLDFWRENYNASSMTIWVELDSIPASPTITDLYVYYGKAGETDASNGTNTFPFFDDFPGTTFDPQWANVQTATVSGGFAHLTQYTDVGAGTESYIMSSAMFAKNKAFEAKLTPASTRSRLGLASVRTTGVGVSNLVLGELYGGTVYTNTNDGHALCDSHAWSTYATASQIFSFEWTNNKAAYYKNRTSAWGTNTVYVPNSGADLKMYLRDVMDVDWVLLRNYQPVPPTWVSSGSEVGPPYFTSSPITVGWYVGQTYFYNATCEYSGANGAVNWQLNTDAPWLTKTSNGTGFQNISGVPTVEGDFYANLSVNDSDSSNYQNNTITILPSYALASYWSSFLGSMNFSKDASNPLISPTESWEVPYLGNPQVIEEPTELRMYYSGWNTTNVNGIGLATSPKTYPPITWTKQGVVFAPNATGGQWDSGTVLMGDIVKFGSTYYLYYEGTPSVGWGGQRAFGLATSTDGIAWTRSPANPILVISGNEYQLEAPTVLRMNPTLWYMYYSYRNGGELPGIRVATSSNGVSWTKVTGDVLSKGAGGTWDDSRIRVSHVYYIGGHYVLIYWGYPGGAVGFELGIAYSTSPTGTFTKYASNPILSPSGTVGAFDEFSLAGPSLFYHAGIWDLFFIGCDNTINQVQRVGLAYSPSLSVGPSITNSPGTSAYTGHTYAWNATSTVADNGTNTWTLVTNASWLTKSYDDQTYCNVSGDPTAEGTFWANLSVADSDSSDFVNWTITVNTVHPEITNTPTTTGWQGVVYSWNATSTTPDVGTNHWALTTNASWLTIQWSDQTHCLIEGTPTVPAIWYVNLTVNDTDSMDYTNYTLTIWWAGPSGTKIWNTTVAGSASDPAVWRPYGVPAPGQSILFNATGIGDCDWDISDTYGSFTVAIGYSGTISVSASFACGDVAIEDGFFDAGSATITSSGNWSLLHSSTPFISLTAPYTAISGTKWLGPGDGMIRATNGDYLAFVRNGTSHVAVGDYAVMDLYRSTDNVVTWHLQTILVNVSTRDIRNYAVGVTQTGRVVIVYSVYDVDNDTWPNLFNYKYSDDNGTTWSTQQTMTLPTVDGFVPTGEWIGEQAYGTMQWINGNGVGFVYFCANATHTQGRFVRSFDNGATWDHNKIWDPSPGPYELTETSSVYLGNGRLIALTRPWGAFGEEMFTSTDNGLTWLDRGAVNIPGPASYPPQLFAVTDTFGEVWVFGVFIYWLYSYSIGYGNDLMTFGTSAWSPAVYVGDTYGIYASGDYNATTGQVTLMYTNEGSFTASIHNITVTFSSTGIFDAGTSTVVMSGSGKTLKTDGQGFYNLDLTGSTTFGSDIWVSNSVNVAGTIDQATYRMNVSGAATNVLSATGTWNGDIYLNGTGTSYSVPITAPFSATGNVYSKVVTTFTNSTNGYITVTPPAATYGAMRISKIDYDAAGPARAIMFDYALSAGTATFTAKVLPNWYYKLYVGSVFTLKIHADGSGSITWTYGSWSDKFFNLTGTASSASIWYQTSGNLASTDANWLAGLSPVVGDDILFNDTSVASCTWDLAITFSNFTVASGYTGTITVTTDFSTTGDFVPCFTGSTFVAGSYTITCGGNWDSSAGTFTYGTSNLIMSGASKTIKMVGGQSVYDLNVTGTISLLTAIVATHTVTATGGTLDLSASNYAISAAGITIGAGGSINGRGSTITCSGNWDSSAGTFTYATSTLNMTGTTKTIKTGASGMFYNLNISGMISIISDLNVSNALSVSGSLTGTPSYQIAVTGATALINGIMAQGNGLWVFGSFTQSGASSLFEGGTQVAFTGGVLISAGTFNASTTTTFITTFTLNGAGTVFNAGAGTVTFSSTTTFTAGTLNAESATLKSTQNWDTTTITWIPGTSYLNMSGAGTTLKTGTSQTLYGLQIAGTITTVSSTNVTKNLVIYGSKSLTIWAGLYVNLNCSGGGVYYNGGTITGAGTMYYSFDTANRVLMPFGTVNAPTVIRALATATANRLCGIGVDTAFGSTFIVVSEHASFTMTFSHGGNYQLTVTGAVTLSTRGIMVQGTGLWTFSNTYTQDGTDSLFDGGSQVIVTGVASVMAGTFNAATTTSFSSQFTLNGASAVFNAGAGIVAFSTNTVFTLGSLNGESATLRTVENWDTALITWVSGTSCLNMTGAVKTLKTGIGQTLYELRISGSTTTTSSTNITYSLTIYATKSLTIGAGFYVDLNCSAGGTYANLGSITGTGTMYYSFNTADATITFGTVNAPVVIRAYANAIGNRICTLGASTTFVGALTIASAHPVWTITLDDGANQLLGVWGATTLGSEGIMVQGTGDWTFWGTFTENSATALFEAGHTINFLNGVTISAGTFNANNAYLLIGHNWDSSGGWFNGMNSVANMSMMGAVAHTAYAYPFNTLNILIGGSVQANPVLHAKNLTIQTGATLTVLVNGTTVFTFLDLNGTISSAGWFINITASNTNVGYLNGTWNGNIALNGTALFYSIYTRCPMTGSLYTNRTMYLSVNSTSGSIKVTPTSAWTNITMLYIDPVSITLGTLVAKWWAGTNATPAQVEWILTLQPSTDYSAKFDGVQIILATSSILGLFPLTYNGIWSAHLFTIIVAKISTGGGGGEGAFIQIEISIKQNGPYVEMRVIVISGNPIIYQWSFGDGAYADGKNATHMYTALGNYTITLTAIDSAGHIAIAEKLVQIKSLTMRGFSITDVLPMMLPLIFILVGGFMLMAGRRPWKLAGSGVVILGVVVLFFLMRGS